ncbi:hypothetical protein LWI29_009360 [Acer saccharum]|uniref:MULE transposase domain-containing protein n=1 Tax=Acer saccharum TaxID=4024 RepID=A0AA39SA64_ACESA|nr:hypothetical protein LWI29_009360 [Acer saccharum]
MVNMVLPGIGGEPLGSVTGQMEVEEDTFEEETPEEERGGPAEELEEVMVREANPPKTVKIGSTLAPKHKAMLQKVLRDYNDVFAWLVICIDATHLKARTRGVLLVAVCKDGNGMIYPLAFGFANSECTKSWTWFLKKLRKGIQNPDRVMLVSNRHNGIFNAMEAIFPDVAHGICVYHLAQNLKRFCKQRDDVMWLYYCAAYAYCIKDFDRFMGEVKETCPKVYDELLAVGGLVASFNADGDGNGDEDNNNLLLILPLSISSLLLSGFAISLLLSRFGCFLQCRRRRDGDNGNLVLLLSLSISGLKLRLFVPSILQLLVITMDKRWVHLSRLSNEYQEDPTHNGTKRKKEANDKGKDSKSIRRVDVWIRGYKRKEGKSISESLQNVLLHKRRCYCQSFRKRKMWPSGRPWILSYSITSRCTNSIQRKC